MDLATLCARVRSSCGLARIRRKRHRNLYRMFDCWALSEVGSGGSGRGIGVGRHTMAWFPVEAGSRVNLARYRQVCGYH